jgi:hypothetical protein
MTTPIDFEDYVKRYILKDHEIRVSGADRYSDLKDTYPGMSHWDFMLWQRLVWTKWLELQASSIRQSSDVPSKPTKTDMYIDISQNTPPRRLPPNSILSSSLSNRSSEPSQTNERKRQRRDDTMKEVEVLRLIGDALRNGTLQSGTLINYVNEFTSTLKPQDMQINSSIDDDGTPVRKEESAIQKPPLNSDTTSLPGMQPPSSTAQAIDSTSPMADVQPPDLTIKQQSPPLDDEVYTPQSADHISPMTDVQSPDPPTEYQLPDKRTPQLDLQPSSPSFQKPSPRIPSPAIESREDPGVTISESEEDSIPSLFKDDITRRQKDDEMDELVETETIDEIKQSDDHLIKDEGEIDMEDSLLRDRSQSPVTRDDDEICDESETESRLDAEDLEFEPDEFGDLGPIEGLPENLMKLRDVIAKDIIASDDELQLIEKPLPLDEIPELTPGCGQFDIFPVL